MGSNVQNNENGFSDSDEELKEDLFVHGGLQMQSFSLEQMKLQANQRDQEILIEDSDDDGASALCAESHRSRKRKDPTGKRKEMRGKRSKKLEGTVEKKKRATVFDLDDDSEEDRHVEKVTSRQIRSCDPSCQRAQELLEMNRRVLMEDFQALDVDGDLDAGRVKGPDSRKTHVISVEDEDSLDDEDRNREGYEDAGRRYVKEDDGSPVLLKLRAKDHSISARLMSNHPLKKALVAFCVRFKLDSSKARMEIDGEVVGEKETPSDYDLEDRSIVDIFIEE